MRLFDLVHTGWMRGGFFIHYLSHKNIRCLCSFIVQVHFINLKSFVKRYISGKLKN